MFGMLYQQMQVTFAENINKVIYTLKRIPFIGKYISDELYALVPLKRVLAVFAAIKSILGDILGKLFYFILAVFLWVVVFVGWFELSEKQFAEEGMIVFWIFFFMNFLLGSFVNSKICACDEKDYLLVGLLRIDAKKYFLLKMFRSQITQTIYYTIIMLVVQCKIFNVDVKTTLLYMVGFAAFRFIGEAFRLYLNDRIGMPFADKSKVANVLYNLYSILIGIIAYATFLVLMILKFAIGIKGIVFPDICVITNNPVFIVAAVSLSIFSIKYLVCYKNYQLVAKRLAGFSTVMAQKEAVEKVTNVNQNIETDDLGEKEVGRKIFEEKSGYEYLNAVFFERHKKIFARPIRIKTAISIILVVASITALLVYKIISPAKEFDSFSNEMWRGFDRIMTLLVFLMYCVTSGRTITKAFFYNCDHSLLKYGYYRKSDAILENFRIRLRFMVKSEIPMLLVISAGFIVDTVILGKIDHWVKLLSIIGCIAMLSIFYSVVYLCMYYIFQPYTEGGKETGIGYSICKGAIYMVSYMCLQIDTLPQYFALIVMVVTIVSLLVGYILAYKMAPKRFVLK